MRARHGFAVFADDFAFGSSLAQIAHSRAWLGQLKTLMDEHLLG
jgi:hypothetical protein